MVFAIIFVFLIGGATGLEVSAANPHISTEINDFQHTTPNQ